MVLQQVATAATRQHGNTVSNAGQQQATQVMGSSVLNSTPRSSGQLLNVGKLCEPAVMFAMALSQKTACGHRAELMSA
jgi:hypothetical protein